MVEAHCAEEGGVGWPRRHRKLEGLPDGVFLNDDPPERSEREGERALSEKSEKANRREPRKRALRWKRTMSTAD